MIEVHPGLFVGDERDYELRVAGRPEWAVVHACKDPYHRQLLGYRSQGAPKDDPEYLFAVRGVRLYLNMVDANLPEFFDPRLILTAMDFVEEHIASGRKVLVHCNLGESRAPSLALLYLASRARTLPICSLEAAEEEFRRLYPAYRPKSGIHEHLRLHWQEYCGSTEEGRV